MSTDDNTQAPEPMELPQNPVDGTWGFICREHGISRNGLTERHAQNVAALHAREQHADPTVITLNVSALADYVLNQVDQAGADVAWACWASLTGVSTVEAMVEEAGEFAGRGITAAVVPF